jgi:hypothetical protein
MAIRLNVELFSKLQKEARFSGTQSAQLMDLKGSRIWRVKKGSNAPDERLIAGLCGFPNQPS